MWITRYAFYLCAGAVVCSVACRGEHVPSTAPSVQSPPSVPAPSPPPRTVVFSVAGTVREVNGGSLAGVRVATNPPAVSTTTDGAGAFAMTDVAQRVLVFQKEGFRFTYWIKPENLTSTSLASLSIKMQPSFTLSTESGVSSVISGDDLTYLSDREDSFWGGTYSCGPCKEIGIRSSFDKGARLHLHWSGPTPLDLWAGAYYSGVTAHAAGAAGESRLVLDVPPGRLDTLLVGVGPRNGVPQTPAQTVSFELTIEAR